MLKAEATDLRAIPMAFDFGPGQVAEIYTNLRGRSLDADLLKTLQSPEHQVIDEFVLARLGLIPEKDYIITSLINKVQRRIKKSKSK